MLSLLLGFCNWSLRLITAASKRDKHFPWQWNHFVAPRLLLLRGNFLLRGADPSIPAVISHFTVQVATRGSEANADA